MTHSSQTQLATAARSKLVARRAVIARSQRHNENDGAELRQDARERATNEEIADVLVSLSDRERKEVDAIDAALIRIDQGTWGLCSKCSQKIEPNRLSAVPEAHTCLECAAAADPVRS